MPILPRPAAILFDLDGTLIDSIELIVRSYQHMTATHFGTPHPREAILLIIGLSLVDLCENLAPGRSVELLSTYRAYALAHHDDLIAEYAGVTEMLDRLREEYPELPLAIVTSKSLASAAPSFRRFALPERMHTVITYEDTERHKPLPDPLLLAARRLNADPGDCWYVGDSTHDMAAARAAGMTGVGAAWGPYGRAVLEPLADAAIDEPGDLLSLIRRTLR